MLDSLFGCWALGYVVSQQRANEVFRTLADTVPNLVLKIELSNLNRFHNLLVRAAIKWRNSRQNDISDHTCRPDVTLLAIMSVQNFWCDVIRRSDLLFKLLLWVKNLSSSKINHLDLIELFASF